MILTTSIFRENTRIGSLKPLSLLKGFFLLAILLLDDLQKLALFQNRIMISLHIERQTSYSRVQLVLRLLLGWFYIVLPHLFLLFFVIIWAKVLWLYSTFYILLKGQYPDKPKTYLVHVLRWLSRVHASAYNLTDVYPKFGLDQEVGYLKLGFEIKEPIDRLSVLVRFIFGTVLLIPHVFIWSFRNLWNSVLVFVAFWLVLFTGKYPEKWFDFQVGTLRWLLRIVGYQLYLVDQYPPFTGKE